MIASPLSSLPLVAAALLGRTPVDGYGDGGQALPLQWDLPVSARARSDSLRGRQVASQSQTGQLGNGAIPAAAISATLGGRDPDIGMGAQLAAMIDDSVPAEHA